MYDAITDPDASGIGRLQNRARWPTYLRFQRLMFRC